MFELDAYLSGLLAMLAAAALTWLISIAKHDVSIVDTLWGLLFLLAAFTYAALASQRGPRALPVIAIVALWAVRLSGYITWRNHGEPEDRRYRAIRRRNEPNFAYKSLYLVFWLAGVARVDRLPPAARRDRRHRAARHVLDYLGICAGTGRAGFRDHRRLAARALQARPRQRSSRHGSRALALLAASELLRRVLRLVGPVR